MMKFSIRYHLPPLVWAIIILVLTSIPQLPVLPKGFDIGDKTAHMGVYFILSLLTMRAFTGDAPRVTGKQFKMTLLFTLLFSILDELHQIPIPGRYGEWADLAADALGIILGALVFSWLYTVLRKRQNSEDFYES